MINFPHRFLHPALSSLRPQREGTMHHPSIPTGPHWDWDHGGHYVSEQTSKRMGSPCLQAFPVGGTVIDHQKLFGFPSGSGGRRSHTPQTTAFRIPQGLRGPTAWQREKTLGHCLPKPGPLTEISSKTIRNSQCAF